MQEPSLFNLQIFKILLFILLFPLFVQCEPSINVALEASFPAAPYLVELLETAAIENETSYFQILDRIADGSFTDLHTEKDLYTKFLEVLQNDEYLRNPESLSSFQFALALHEAAPRIQAHFQYYNTSIQPRLPIAQDAACPIWIHYKEQQYCSPTLDRAQQAVSIEGHGLPFDRVMSGGTDLETAILYADIAHPLFPQYHNSLSEKAHAGKLNYKLRYRPSSITEEKPLYVSGYGVELVLKRTDYIVIDDREASANDNPEQISLQDTNEAEAADLKPLTTSELADLGVNTANFITSSDDPLETLVQVTSNFPKYSSLLASKNATSEFVAEHRRNREKLLRSGFNVMWLNGLQVEPRQVNAYSLLERLRRERRIIDQMKQIGLTASEAIDLLSHEVVTQSQADDTPQRFDWRDELEDGKVIIWLNDLEKDQRYSSWPSALRALFQRTYPGQLPQIGRDIHNLIVPIDVTNIDELAVVTTSLQNLVNRAVPLRMGIVLHATDDVALIYAKLSYYLLETYGLKGLIGFFEGIISSRKISSNAEKAFATATANLTILEGKETLGYEEILQLEYLAERQSSAETYLTRLDLSGPNPVFVLNGIVLSRTDSWFELLSSRVYYDLQVIQQAVYEGIIEEDAWIPEFFLSSAASRRSSLVIPHDKKEIVIADVAELFAQHGEKLTKIPRIVGENSALLSDRVHILVIVNFDSEEGRHLLSESLIFQKTHPEVELSILHNGASELPVATSCHFYKLLQEVGPVVSNDKLTDMLKDDAGSSQTLQDVYEECAMFWSNTQPILNSLGIRASDNAVWLNGRLLKLSGKPLSSLDLDVLLEYEQSQRIAPVTTAITGLNLEDKFDSPLDLARLTSIVARSHIPDLPEGLRDSAPLVRIDRFKIWEGKHTSIQLPVEGEASIQVTAVVDPASELAQEWVPLLATLSKMAGVKVTIYLNPEEKLSELPIKRFYRQIVSSAPSFHPDGSLITPKASFTKMPKDTLFNLGMTVPPSWLVAPKKSIHDLDNIKLGASSTEDDIEAVYELEHILVEGHARDLTTGSPPRGVQLLLGTDLEPHFTDTIIMANIGYFQFKANPGIWDISIEPGRSSKVFNLDSVGPNGYYAQPGDETSSVALLSFRGVTLFPRFSRKQGMETEDVLEPSTLVGGAMDYFNKGASFASSALSSFGLRKARASSSTEIADINVFSVASGHLYERMLNIMMVSVMRHTKHSVKFWFIEQFLSPSFKATLPYLSTHYNFQYEMVTYKWPHWLRGQKEKQREIWGYKILFLDVLFPLNLDKVIFVDADQIVRTDLMDLNKVDLHGAPYGFTPMCDSRTEMEGFRFWKQGYWQNFLKGKPYHISALYVVDLKKFRQLAAGDRLRQQYQALSADPNSLSNLDQDLPNHMQHSLPIHSLSQDWLWCETWCSDESLITAKTIDLCNNPLTKEPKLDRARRQVPEWTEYDDEIAAVIKNALDKLGNDENDLPDHDDRHGGDDHDRKVEKNIKDEL